MPDIRHPRERADRLAGMRARLTTENPILFKHLNRDGTEECGHAGDRAIPKAGRQPCGHSRRREMIVVEAA